MECLSASAPENPTPIGTFLPNKSGNSGSDPDDEESFPGGGEESFWTVFKTVAKIGSVALPSASAFLGPAGILLGTVAGGVLGSLAESVVQSVDSPKTPDEDLQESCIQRAQLAEAVLQCVIRLGQSSQSNKVFAKMEEIWSKSYSRQIPHLVDFISPVLTEYGFFIAANNWEKEVQPNPEERKVLQGENDKFSLDPPENIGDNKKAKFVHALFSDTKRVEGIPADQESFTAWFKPLIEKAILIAKPLATEAAKSALQAIIDRVTKSSSESFAPGDKQRQSFEHVIRRALMADCALQAVETMDEKELQGLKLSPTDAGHEEGIIDSIKTRVQKIGPVALKYAKRTVRKYIPVLLKQLAKKLDAKESNVDLTALNSARLTSLQSADLLASLKSRTLPVSAFPPERTVARLYKDDGNPDAPPVEPRPPASPKE